MLAVYWIVFTFGITRLSSVKAVGFSNVHCHPYINYVETDSHFKYHPYVVKLHRCAGRDIASTNFGCIPKDVQDVSVQVQDRASQGVLRSISLKNITSCEEKCLLNETSCNEYQKFDVDDCLCQCEQSSPPSTCISPFRWDRQRCDCICPIDPSSRKCPKKMSFDKEYCKCMCKEKIQKRCKKQGKMLDPESCLCMEFPDTGQSVGKCDNNGVSEVVVVVIVIVEFILIVLLYIFFKKFCDDPMRIFRKYCPTKTVDAESCKKEETVLVES